MTVNNMEVTVLLWAKGKGVLMTNVSSFPTTNLLSGFKELRSIIPAITCLIIVSFLLIGGCNNSGSNQTGEACETEGSFLILNNQSYALCATADCFSFNQVAYCKCDLLKGDSISAPFDYDDNQKNICTLNQQGKTNGFRASTFSFPDDVAFPGGKTAIYTCPGVTNKGEGVAARGSYAQCDGGLCFTSTKGKLFPGFDDELLLNEIICSCPFATICEPASVNPVGLGYQMSGTYSPEEGPGPGVGGCSPEACGLCSAGALTEEQCDLPNPIGQIGIQENIPVGGPTGISTALSILLLGEGNVPPENSCLCECVDSDENGICTQWTVEDESPFEVP